MVSFWGLDYAADVAIQADGKIVVAGTSRPLLGDPAQAAIARLNTDGSLDATFGLFGRALPGIGEVEVSSLAIQTDGKLVVTGELNQGYGSAFAVARLNCDGSRDSTFDGDGLATVDFEAGDGSWNRATDIALQEDGKIIVAGFANRSGAADEFALARLNTNGAMDGSFGHDGKVTIADVTTSGYEANVAVQTDGKIVVAGTTTSADRDTDFAVIRLTSYGNLDGTFGDGGRVSIDNSLQDMVFGMVVQRDGKIVVAGHASAERHHNCTVIRLLDDTLTELSPATFRALDVATTAPFVTAGKGFGGIGTFSWGQSLSDAPAMAGDGGMVSGQLQFEANAGPNGLSPASLSDLDNVFAKIGAGW